LPLLLWRPLLSRFVNSGNATTFGARNGVLRVAFLDVGQGDAAVIETPSGRVVVVDGGGHPGTDERDGNDPGARVVVPYLRSRGVRRVDLLIPTHPDDDHVQGLIAVANAFPVSAALDGGFFRDRVNHNSYDRLVGQLRRKRIPFWTARRGAVLDLGDGARLEIASPPRHGIAGRSATNTNSVVLRLVYGKARVLLTGDAETATEADMMNAHVPLVADVLKVGHHGSRWGTGTAFLGRVRPSVAIVSVGARNTYGHPAPDVLARLAASPNNPRVFRTDRDGAVIVETDGARIRVTPTVAGGRR